MTEQLEAWTGKFGTEYTLRNQPSWESRVAAFRTILTKAQGVTSALEVGCNRGHNLIALREILGSAVRLQGLEPNETACEFARANTGCVIAQGSAFSIGANAGSFDLVFTSGVLIHIASEDLDKVLREICRVSRKYIVAIEYNADVDISILYRGHENLLWKRNFGKRYLDVLPELALVDSGNLGPEDGFDPCTWWLISK
jgi:pseudaminic acid biosynthesis-associated methylase